MRLTRQWVNFDDGKRRAYMARPEVPTAAASAAMPVVLVIQEAWGVDAHIRDVTERFATAGYVAVAPDLYWQGGALPDSMTEDRVGRAKGFMDTLPVTAWGDVSQRDEALNALPRAERAELGETLAAVFGNLGKTDEFLRILRDAVDFLTHYGHTAGQPMVSIGFCIGGSLSFRLATEAVGLRAAVVCYGSAPSDAAIERLSCPVVGLYGGTDTRITDVIPHVAEVARNSGRSFAYEIYRDAPHAFFNDTRVSYRVDAARAAWARILALFAEVTAAVPVAVS